MLPNIPIIDFNFAKVEDYGKTKKIDFDYEKIDGETDNIDAVKQAIYLILNTERYNYPIFSWNYGFEVNTLFGQPVSYVIPELKRRITEALMMDNRILGCYDFEFKRNGTKMQVEFLVKTKYGNINQELEVAL